MMDESSKRGVKEETARRWVLFKDAAAALSLANFCLLQSWMAMLSGDNHGYYEDEAIQTAGLLALIFNMILLAALFWMGVRLLRRTQNRVVLVLGCLALLVVLTVPAEFVRWRMLHQVKDRQMLALISHPVAWLAGASLLGVVLVWPRFFLRFVGEVVFIFFPFALFCLGKIVLVLLHVVTPEQPPGHLEPFPAYSPSPPPVRVVWIIFDEMDQRLSFPERPPGLPLPEFDRLRAESLAAERAYSPADCTLISIPSLLTGRICHEAQPSSASDLALTVADAKGLVQWSGLTNIFSEVRSLGYNTAVVGFSHPYARLLPQALNFCEWRRFPVNDPARDASFWRSVGRQIRAMSPTLQIRAMYVRNYQALLHHSLAVTADSRYGLVFLHLPVPHKPPIYNPATGKLTLFGGAAGMGYFNNLQLADRTLGEIRRGMASAGLWDKTWVLVSSDHLWRDAPSYDGKRDYRVPFLLKPPGDGQGVSYGLPMNTVISHDLILAILRGQISTVTQIPEWLKSQPASPRPQYQLSDGLQAK